MRKYLLVALLITTPALASVVLAPAQYRKPCPPNFPVYEFNYFDVARQCAMWGKPNKEGRVESCTVLSNNIPKFRIMPRVDNWNVTAAYRAKLDAHECAIANGWNDEGGSF